MTLCLNVLLASQLLFGIGAGHLPRPQKDSTGRPIMPDTPRPHLLRTDIIPLREPRKAMSLASDATGAEQDDGIVFDCNLGADSMPGTPKVRGYKISVTAPNATVQALGDRVLQAAAARDAVRSCHSFFSFGDFTWCNKAMPAESDFAKKNLYSGAFCDVEPGPMSALQENETLLSFKQTDGTTKSVREVNNGQIEALSYGVNTFDPWSELMSNHYFVHSRLYECHQRGEGPMATDWNFGHSKEKPCKDRRCYSVPYERNQICLSTEQKEQDGMKFLPLHEAIRGRSPLSVHVKLDVGGAEWGVLEQLLKNDDDLAAIRTLDLKANLWASDIPLTRRVELFEALAKKFAVTGSTLKPLFSNVFNEFKANQFKDPSFTKNGGSVYTSAGLPVEQFAISYMNRALL